MTDSDQIVRNVVDATVAAVGPERIILFGSRARGDARPDSDLDLLVVAGDSFSAQRTRQSELRKIRRALWGIRIPVDILLYSNDEIREWADSPNDVIARSLREGLSVYKRPSRASASASSIRLSAD